MGILLVYDVTDERSFSSKSFSYAYARVPLPMQNIHAPRLDVRNWFSNIEQHASEGVNKILIGNKCDMEEKRVSCIGKIKQRWWLNDGVAIGDHRWARSRVSQWVRYSLYGNQCKSQYWRRRSILWFGKVTSCKWLMDVDLKRHHFRDIKKRLIDTQQAQQTRQREEVRLDATTPSKSSSSSGPTCCQ